MPLFISSNHLFAQMNSGVEEITQEIATFINTANERREFSAEEHSAVLEDIGENVPADETILKVGKYLFPHLNGGIYNGNMYTQRALESMAEDLPDHQKMVEFRFKAKTGGKDFYDIFQKSSVLKTWIVKYINKEGPQPRSIPPSQIEKVIKNGKKNEEKTGECKYQNNDLVVATSSDLMNGGVVKTAYHRKEEPRIGKNLIKESVPSGDGILEKCDGENYLLITGDRVTYKGITYTKHALERMALNTLQNRNLIQKNFIEKVNSNIKKELEERGQRQESLDEESNENDFNQLNNNELNMLKKFFNQPVDCQKLVFKTYSQLNSILPSTVEEEIENPGTTDIRVKMKEGVIIDVLHKYSKCIFNEEDAGKNKLENTSYCDQMAKYMLDKSHCFQEKGDFFQEKASKAKEGGDEDFSHIFEQLAEQYEMIAHSSWEASKLWEAGNAGQIRLLSKLASADEVQGVDDAEKLSVQKLLDGSSTGATKQFAAKVEFGKQSIKLAENMQVIIATRTHLLEETENVLKEAEIAFGKINEAKSRGDIYLYLFQIWQESLQQSPVKSLAKASLLLSKSDQVNIDTVIKESQMHEDSFYKNDSSCRSLFQQWIKPYVKAELSKMDENTSDETRGRTSPTISSSSIPVSRLHADRVSYESVKECAVEKTEEGQSRFNARSASYKAAEKQAKAIEAEAANNSEVAGKYSKAAEQQIRSAEFYTKAASEHAAGKTEVGESWFNAGSASYEAAEKQAKAIKAEAANNSGVARKYHEAATLQIRSAGFYTQAANAFIDGKIEGASLFNAADCFYEAAEKLEEAIETENACKPEEAEKYCKIANQSILSGEYFAKAAAAFAVESQSKEGISWVYAGKYTQLGVESQIKAIEAEINGNLEGEDHQMRRIGALESASKLMEQSEEAYTEGNRTKGFDLYVEAQQLIAKGSP